MGVFFQDREEKSTKIMIIIRTVIAILMVILFISSIINGFDFNLLRMIFILAGVGSLLNGVEEYRQRNNGKRSLFEFGFATLWFLLAFCL